MATYRHSFDSTASAGTTTAVSHQLAVISEYFSIKIFIQPGEGATLHQIPHWTEIGLTAWNREMLRQVLKKNIHPKPIKSIIKLYDFEQCQPFPTAESTLQLEQIFGVDRVPWPDTYAKLSIIQFKASKELKSLLRRNG